jgi:hypothetical protein
VKASQIIGRRSVSISNKLDRCFLAAHSACDGAPFSNIFHILI